MNRNRCVLCLIGLGSLTAFLCGPLFAWSPVHPGYRLLRSSRADVLYPASAALDPAYREIDRYVAAAENFHELKCAGKIKVVVCRDWSDCLRFAAPFLIGPRPAAVTIATGTVIFVTPSAAGWADLGGLLRHELSHAVLGQNRPLWNIVRMLRQPWVSEGVAGVLAGRGVTVPGRHLASLSEPEFLSRAASEDLWPSFAAAPRKDWRFSYAAWLYFWDRQILLKGKPAFLRFERMCFSDPDGCKNAFAVVYGTDLRQCVQEFEAEVRLGRVVPPDQIGF